MPQNFTMLDNEVGLQFKQQDIPNDDPVINPIFVGQFKRGRLDKPMNVTLENIRAVLGHDIRNKDYVAVRDMLDTGIHRVQVFRVCVEQEIVEYDSIIRQEDSDLFILTEDLSTLNEE